MRAYGRILLQGGLAIDGDRSSGIKDVWSVDRGIYCVQLGDVDVPKTIAQAQFDRDASDGLDETAQAIVEVRTNGASCDGKYVEVHTFLVNGGALEHNRQIAFTLLVP